MTKVELVKEIAGSTGISKEDALAVIEAFMVLTKKQVIAGGEVTLRGLGTFKGKLRAGKIARNIAAGTPLVVEPKYIPYFKPAIEFKSEVGKVKVD